MSNIAQYLSDHANAGNCAAAYYSNAHDTATCRAPAGVCSVIAYLVAELKNAEYRASTTPPQYSPNPIPPLSPIPPVTTNGTNGDNYSRPGPGTGGNGSVPWSDGLGRTETRRS